MTGEAGYEPEGERGGEGKGRGGESDGASEGVRESSFSSSSLSMLETSVPGRTHEDWGSGLRVQEMTFRVQDSGFRVQGDPTRLMEGQVTILMLDTRNTKILDPNMAPTLNPEP